MKVKQKQISLRKKELLIYYYLILLFASLYNRIFKKYTFPNSIIFSLSKIGIQKIFIE